MSKVSASKLLALLAAYSAASYSSDYTYGYTPNVAAGGTNWNMSSTVLGVDPVPGLDISGVLYRYTAVKERQDPFVVSIQNEDAINGGFVFREQDDWSGRSGATINKLVPLPYTPINRWGRGSIETTGVGSVEDPVVLYTYRLKPPELEVPEAEIPTVGVYNALHDEAVINALAPTDRELFEDDEVEKKEGEDEEKESMEKAFAANDNALTLANEMSQNAMLKAMNLVTIQTYYAASIPGGAYQESVVLVDNKLPDNRRAFRSMANDRLHTEMVEEQYR
jgi:hypothetical protein